MHRLYHPLYEYKFFDMQNYASVKSLLVKVMKRGKITGLQPTLKQIRQKTIHSLFTLHETHKRLINPHIYKVSISEKLKTLKFKLIEKHANR
jgi:nicotinate phosphoribosyltransferase